MAIAGLVVLGVGVVMIIVGLVMTVIDWLNRSEKHPGNETRRAGAADTINALQKLVRALEKHPIGIRLIVLGLVCVILGGAIGGAAEIESFVSE